MKTSVPKPGWNFALIIFTLGFITLGNLSARAQSSPVPRPGHAAQAQAFEAMRLRDENGVIATNGLINALQQAQQMTYDAAAWPGAAKPQTGGPQPKVADLNTNNWQWLGPGNVGGRIRAIVIHPTDTNTMWVGSVGGGVWKTTNGAASFFPCNDWMANLAVCCMALDPTDPNTLYAGTGEGFGNGDAIRGAGIFKSSDGGITYTQLTTYAQQNDINRLSICPTNHLVLLTATGNGIWRSTNGGTNWTETLTNGTVKQVAYHPTDGSRAIASFNGMVSYSTNGGLTWTPAAGLTNSGRVEFAYAPSSPNIVYASQDTNEGSLFMSTDGGMTYTLANTGTNYLGTQGWYGNCIWVDPTNPNNLVVGGIDLYLSTNGGANLTKISDWAVNQNNDALVSVHADHHAIVSQPGFDGLNNTTVYFGNDGGFYATTNIYTVTINTGWTNLNHNLGVTQLYAIAGNPTNLTTVSGNQDNGSTRWTATGGTSWTTWSGGDGGFVAADPTDPNYFYGEYVYLQIYRSTDGANTESYIYSGGLNDAGIPDGYDDGDTNAPHSANFIAPFVLDPNNPNTMLAGGSNLWRSVNVKADSVTWTNIKKGTNGSFISAIAVAPGNSDIIWVGHNNGLVFATANGTAASPTWTRKDQGSPNLPRLRTCTSLAIDPTNPNIVYATFGGFNADNLYRTTDGGATWANLASSLPTAPIYSVVIAPFNHNYIYVGTEVGVFGSANAGSSWSPANEGPANVQTLQLAWARNSLLAATHGRGAYRIALGPPTVVITPAAITVTSGQSQTFTTSAIGAPPLTLQWQYNGSNIVGATGITLTVTNLQPGNSGRYSCVATSAEGTSTGAATLTVIDPPPYLNQALAMVPAAYYRLNEISGSTAYDIINGNNGTDNGTLVLGVPGPTPPAFPGFENGNTAYQFNGNDTSVSLPALNLGSGAVTITAWVKLNGIQGYYPGIVSWNSSGTASISLGFNNGGDELTYMRNGFVYSTGKAVPTNIWTFVALAISQTNAVLYMATNSSVASYNTGTVDPVVAAFTNTAYIGKNAYGNYNGVIDEVAIYNQLLTPAQITSLAAASQTLLPAITLTTPADGSAFTSGSNISLAANVATNGHTINNVQFFSSTNLLATVTTPPYQYTVSNALRGVYTFLAKVVYDSSSVADSLPANVTVTNIAPVLANDTAITTQNTPVAISVLTNDTDLYGLPLSVQSVSQPSRGNAVISGTNVIYTPNNFTYGVDTFNYTASDVYGPAATANVTVTTIFPNYASQYTNVLLADGPVAYWRFNETSGTTAYDYVGGYNGTNFNIVPGVSGVGGPFIGFESNNTAYLFNGTNADVSVPALNLNTNTVTITAWVKLNSVPSFFAGIFDWHSGSPNGEFLFYQNQLGYSWNGNSVYAPGLYVPTNSWAFVAMVVSPATTTIYLATNSTLAFYSSGITNDIAAFNTASVIGTALFGYVQGKIDEVAVFKYALTQSQISDLLTAAQTAAPTITLTAPTNNSAFGPNPTIAFAASVTTNGNHTIDQVQFFTNATMLASASTPPYAYTWNNAPAGGYSAFARVKYDGTSSADSTIANITITNSSAAANFTSVNLAGGTVTMNIAGAAGQLYNLQRTTNLLSGWTTIWTTNAPASGAFSFTDVIAPSLPAAFYRLSW